MNISVIGTGYVGLVTGTCFAEMGNNITCVDIDAEKIEKLKQGIIPIYEPGLDKMVKENYQAGRLSFTTSIQEAITQNKICFIAVGTPMGENGSADLQHIIQVAKDIGKYLQSHMFIVDKSTVPVGTANKVKAVIQGELDKRGSDISFDIISNPEFLKEGAAVEDFMRPDRVVIGVEREKPIEILKELYAPFTRNHDRLVVMDLKSAEMTKYAANAMLATKISFINEIANICERVGADINMVRKGIGSDSRIGYSFIYPGCGYGGSCFPKDVRALIKTSLDHNYRPELLSSVESVNASQKLVLVDKIKTRFGNDLSGFKFAIWGLSFKPETDDMREASSIVVINELVKLGAHVYVYDPKAIEHAMTYYLKDVKNITYLNNKYDAIKDTDALVVITEWKEFRSPDICEMKEKMKNHIIFDGRNIYNKEHFINDGFEIYQIGVSNGSAECVE